MTNFGRMSLWMLAVSSVALQGPMAHAMVNPPSAYCEKLGGKTSAEIRPDGVGIDICTFEGGRQCEAWALYRQQCPPGGVSVETGMSPGARYCVLRGGKFAASGKGQCTFDTGKVCDVTDYHIGKCD